jgi:phage head maturation protease
MPPGRSKVRDNTAWQKVLSRTYNGFSTGGKYARTWTDTSGRTHYVADPCEISLVDRPAVPDATFKLVKADKFANERIAEAIQVHSCSSTNMRILTLQTFPPNSQSA